ncbi:MAG TPA: response regulator [Kiritimatiellia bacterium]|nr:response regulator [Kiritimatiellia bacterium]HRR35053.1 response regulator [Kiritimatiellia bacterium]HRU71669.1 response regulator [Kiritimatiellia bacterium]
MQETKILIVEDDLDQAVGLSVRLRANGYEVLFASDGTTAFTQACKIRPDLIFLDLGLPAGDGFKVIEWLSGMVTTAVIPVIVLSGRVPEGNSERVLRMGAKAFFQKPVDNDILLKTIREVLTTHNTANKHVRPDLTGEPPASSMRSRIARWHAELRDAPNDTDLMNDIARVLATSSDPTVRNVDEALHLISRAMSLKGAPTPTILDTLGMAYAAKGHFSQALLAAKKAYAMAVNLGLSTQAIEIHAHIKQYENNQAVVE